MRLIITAGLTLTLLGAATAGAAPPPSGTLTIEVSNVRVSKGRVHLDVCPEAKFLKDGCPYSASAVARRGVTVLTVPNVPPGRYAIQAFLDENSNGKVDMGLFGKVPKEGIGFSNNPKLAFSAPKFPETAVDVTGGPQKFEVKLKYYTGDPGPG